MWGSSFADFAKKAQELQEQASQISVSFHRHFLVYESMLLCPRLSQRLPVVESLGLVFKTGEFFNLDAIQSIADEQKKEEKTKPKKNHDMESTSQHQAPTQAQVVFAQDTSPFQAQKPAAQDPRNGELKILAKRSDLDPLTETTDDQPPTTETQEGTKKQALGQSGAAESVHLVAKSARKDSQDKHFQSTEGCRENEYPLKSQQHLDGKNEIVADGSTEPTQKHAETVDETVASSNQENEEAEQIYDPPNSATPEGTGFSINHEISEKEKGARIEEKSPATEEYTNQKDSVQDVTLDKELTEEMDDEAAGIAKNFEQSDDNIERNQGIYTEATVSTSSLEENTLSQEGNGPLTTASQVTADVLDAVKEAHQKDQRGAISADSEQVMEKFTLQLQRLEENFQIERQEMERQHTAALQHAIASKDEELKHVQQSLQEKDKKLCELSRIKEGGELKMDSLRREVEGTKELLQKK